MPTSTLLLDLELQLWILTAAGSHSTGGGQDKERAGSAQHQDATGQWYLTCHLPVGNTFPLTEVLWINGCLDGGPHPSPLGSTRGPMHNGHDGYGLCPCTQLSTEGCQHSPGSSVLEGYAPQTSIHLCPAHVHTHVHFLRSQQQEFAVSLMIPKSSMLQHSL